MSVTSIQSAVIQSAVIQSAVHRGLSVSHFGSYFLFHPYLLHLPVGLWLFFIPSSFWDFFICVHASQHFASKCISLNWVINFTVCAFNYHIRANFLDFLFHPFTLHWCSSILLGKAKIIHLGRRSPDFLIRVWLIPKQVMHTELSLDSQYFSTIFTSYSKRSLEAYSIFASTSPLTIITIAEACLLLLSCCSLKQLSLIS